jgi:hypothetical protein
MLKNFVNDTDLKRYYPTFASYIPATQADFSVQITEAFKLVLDDLVARGLEPRKMMIPIDLCRSLTSTSDQNTLTSVSATAAAARTHIDGIAGYRRFVITPSALAGATVIVLEGSNDIDVDDSTEPVNFSTIKSFTLTTTTEVSHVFTDEYKYYRLRVVSVASGTTTFTSALYETSPDRWIMWRALQVIFSGMSKDPQDIWAERARQAEQFYDTALQAYKVSMDENDNNLPDDATTSPGETRFTL